MMICLAQSFTTETKEGLNPTQGEESKKQWFGAVLAAVLALALHGRESFASETVRYLRIVLGA